MTNRLVFLPKIILFLLFLFLLCSGCTEGGISPDTTSTDMSSKETINSPASELPDNEESSLGACNSGVSEIDVSVEIPLTTIPIVNDYYKEGNYTTHSENYVYLTDGAGAVPSTLVIEGNKFLGWKAVTIKTVFHEYDDGSITYSSVLVEFKGAAKVRAYLEYTEFDPETEYGGFIYVAIFEESLSLVPNLPHRSGWVAFHVYPDETNCQLFDLFRELEGGIIEDAIIVINNYRIVFAFTNAADTAKIVKVMLEDTEVFSLP